MGSRLPYDNPTPLDGHPAVMLVTAGVQDRQESSRAFTYLRLMESSVSDVWYENGRGLLDAGWYAAHDEEGRLGPFETEREAKAALEEAGEQEP